MNPTTIDSMYHSEQLEIPPKDVFKFYALFFMRTSQVFETKYLHCWLRTAAIGPKALFENLVSAK